MIENEIIQFPTSGELVSQSAVSGPHPGRPRPNWLVFVNKAPKKGENFPRQAILIDLYPLEAASCDIESKDGTFVSFSSWAALVNPEEITWPQLRSLSRRLINRISCHLIGPDFRRQPYFDPDNLKLFASAIATRFWKLLQAYGLIYRDFKQWADLNDKSKCPFGVKFDSTFNGDHQNFGVCCFCFFINKI